MGEKRRSPDEKKKRRRQRRRRKLRRRVPPLSVMPTLVTLGNLVCGFTAIHFAAKPIEATELWGWSTLTVAGALVFLGMFLDAIDEALEAHASIPELPQIEFDPLLQCQGLVGIEGIVGAVVAAEALRAQVAVEVQRVLGAHDGYARGVVGVVEELVVALYDLGQRRHVAAAGGTVEALEHLVHALAYERLDGLDVGRNLQDVAVLELARTVFEVGEPRVTVDLRHSSPSSRAGSAIPARG